MQPAQRCEARQESPQPGPLKTNLGTPGRPTPSLTWECWAPGILWQEGKLPRAFQHTEFTFPRAGVPGSLGLGWCHCKECPCCSRNILPGSPPQSRGKDTHWQHYFRFHAISAVFSSVNGTEYLSHSTYILKGKQIFPFPFWALLTEYLQLKAFFLKSNWMSNCSLSQESYTVYLPLPLLERKLLNLMLQELYLQQRQEKLPLTCLLLSLTFEGIVWKTQKELSKLAANKLLVAQPCYTCRVN